MIDWKGGGQSYVEDKRDTEAPLGDGRGDDYDAIFARAPPLASRRLNASSRPRASTLTFRKQAGAVQGVLAK